jgi:hypothetical protein
MLLSKCRKISFSRSAKLRLMLQNNVGMRGHTYIALYGPLTSRALFRLKVHVLHFAKTWTLQLLTGTP